MPEVRSCPIAALRLPDNLPECLLHPSPEAVATAARYGQIMPILARPEPGGDLLALGGLAHFIALKAAGVGALLCRIAPDDMDAERLFGLRILSDRELFEKSPIAQAWMAQEMRAALDAAALNALLPRLGLKPHQAEERVALLRLPSPTQAALHEGVLAAKNAALLRRLPAADQTALVELVRRYALGGSKQRQLLELALELRLREETDVATLLAAWRSSAPPTDNAPQEAGHLLHWLEARAHPTLNAAEARFQEAARNLRLPQGWSLTHTQSFEDDGVALHVNFADWAALERGLPELLRMAETGNRDR